MVWSEMGEMKRIIVRNGGNGERCGQKWGKWKERGVVRSGGNEEKGVVSSKGNGEREVWSEVTEWRESVIWRF